MNEHLILFKQANLVSLESLVELGDDLESKLKESITSLHLGNRRTLVKYCKERVALSSTRSINRHSQETHVEESFPCCIL